MTTLATRRTIAITIVAVGLSLSSWAAGRTNVDAPCPTDVRLINTLSYDGSAVSATRSLTGSTGIPG